MKTELEKGLRHLDKIISFHKKEMIKSRKAGNGKEYTKNSTVLDLMYELKRYLTP